jgi:type IV secretory pathway TrbF-like protein/predicted MFS family arabinose efflux permease
MAYLFRTIVALIASDLSADLALDAADMGLLTSVYFLTFGALQVPVGIWLDRYDPRRVESVLLLFAVAGALLFAISQGFAVLILSRALIGVGVAATFIGGLKAIALWFPPNRRATMNGYLLMLGALGALAASSPAQLLLDWSGGWRGLFVVLAVVTAVCVVTIWFVVPESAPAEQSKTPVSLKTIYGDRRFWSVAPLSATCVGAAWALQSLWAGRWLTDVDGLSQADVTHHLFVMGAALSIAALVLGTAVDRLRRRGIGPQALLGLVATIVIATQLALVLRWPMPSSLAWSLVAVAGSAPVLSYAILADCFPPTLAGRANGALNLFHFGGAFAVQYLIGVILTLWPIQGGHYPAIAYQVAFGLILSLQAAALAWFAFFRSGARSSRYAARRRSVTVWDRVNIADRQVVLWQRTSLGSISLSVCLGFVLVTSMMRTSILSAAAVAARADELPVVPPTIETTPPEAEIAYGLAEFLKDVRTLSSDPVVVRANWDDALNHVTARGAQVLNDYARTESPFAKIGRRTVTVLVTKVARTAPNTFQVWWEENVAEGGMARQERFAGLLAVTINAPKASEQITKNPFGIYVDWFTWWPDPDADRLGRS